MRRWIGLALALLGVALLLLIVFGMARGILGFLNSVDDAGTPDAMYDQYPADAAATRPPELSEDEAAYGAPQDMSANWVYDELNPVEMTAEELAGTANDN